MRSALFHEDIHRTLGEEDKSSEDLNSVKGVKDHLFVYQQEISNPFFKYTTEDYKKHIYQNYEHLLLQLNFFQNEGGKDTVDSEDSKQYRAQLEELKKEVSKDE